MWDSALFTSSAWKRSGMQDINNDTIYEKNIKSMVNFSNQILIVTLRSKKKHCTYYELQDKIVN